MERAVYMCICVCICANNMQILGFGGVGGLGVGGGYHWGGRGGVWGSGDRAHIYIYIPLTGDIPNNITGVLYNYYSFWLVVKKNILKNDGVRQWEG